MKLKKRDFDHHHHHTGRYVAFYGECVPEENCAGREDEPEPVCHCDDEVDFELLTTTQMGERLREAGY